MFRRPKVILFCILMAIVCLVMVHLYLNWRPANPLRFRITAPRSVPSGGEGARMVDYPVTVENTSSATIRLIMAIPFPPKEKDGDEDEYDNPSIGEVRPPHRSAEPLAIIPPHGTCELIVSLVRDRSPEDLKGATMRYFTVTPSRAAFIRAVVRFQRDFAYLKINTLFPDESFDMHEAHIQFP
ncbi:hypothetical protein [Roseimicrobium sp. ORNL1]|uniref:hypothetical protein n=1 Tax=Roseimicrobium sp. ORNL1 TaxID=2711231 RepID=UPI0013E1D809|nr:hypothetical protein [Roseimicrobium sp. ORNL1]QIF01991.1 hypothetical protein G5S37_10760 [Roseimicrobium sp. ORNL1]